MQFESDITILFSEVLRNLSIGEEDREVEGPFLFVPPVLCLSVSWLAPIQVALASEELRVNAVYEVGELFELGIQLSYLLLLLALLGVGSFFVIRQVLVRRELDLSAKELQVSTFISHSSFCNTPHISDIKCLIKQKLCLLSVSLRFCPHFCNHSTYFQT